MTLAADLRTDIDDAIDEVGKTVSIIRKTQGNWIDPTNPSKGKTITTSTYTAAVAISSYESKMIDGTIIKAGDKMMIMSLASVLDADGASVAYNTTVTPGLITNAILDSPISSVLDTKVITCGITGVSDDLPINGLVMLSDFTTATNNTTVPTKITNSDATSITVEMNLVTEAADIPIGATIRLVGIEGATGDITTDVTGGVYSLLSTLLDFTLFPIVAGDWIQIGDTEIVNQFDTATCNGWCRVASVAAHKIVFNRYPLGFVSDFGTGKKIHILFGNDITTEEPAFVPTTDDFIVDGSDTWKIINVETPELNGMVVTAILHIRK